MQMMGVNQMNKNILGIINLIIVIILHWNLGYVASLSWIGGTLLGAFFGASVIKTTSCEVKDD